MVAISILKKNQRQGLNRQHQCPHYILQPRWSAVEDMGYGDKADGFVCESCGKAFSSSSKEQSKKNSWQWVIELLLGDTNQGRREGAEAGDESLRVLRIDRTFLRQKHRRVHFIASSTNQDSANNEALELPLDQPGAAADATALEAPSWCVVPVN